MSSRESVMERIRHPASAAIAGIIFAVIMGIVVVLLQDASPETVTQAQRWTSDISRLNAVDTALSLIPFAGIAFLWFIGVLRSQVGTAEDRFIETVFMGSGLLLVALLFVAASVLKAVLVVQSGGVSLAGPQLAWAWNFGAVLLGVFATRMQAVFTISVTTVGRRSGAIPRWLAAVGYLVGTLLLLTPPLPRAANLLFPAWVMLLSVFILLRRHRMTQ